MNKSLNCRRMLLVFHMTSWWLLYADQTDLFFFFPLVSPDSSVINLAYHSFYFQITQDQVIMSHSPLRMFKKFHDKCVLVSGQGPVLEIAKKYPEILLGSFLFLLFVLKFE